ncbi:MAG: aminoacyl-tRNA hydrolase [Clostridia bacterium]|nr:aminoacyl-tRNA hydrolase [Clostridia bacterium]
MYIIVGLGNPGKEYEHTRHNAGFDVIDILADKYNISVTTKKFQALIGDGIINNKRVMLVKPQTFMNLSGNSVKEIINFYHLTNEDLMIIYDDISLDVGNMRIRTKGSAGGHNGIKSIISQVGSDTFDRIKVGVGDKKDNQDLADHVLSKMSKSDREEFEVTLNNVADAVFDRLGNDMNYIMNKYNAKKEK